MSESLNDIQFLTRDEIDPAKWDNTIVHSSNGLIYSRSVYLDCMSKNWSALIWRNYEAVMPLTWNRKFGITYLYQPAFTAQLGLSFLSENDQSIISQFIAAVNKQYRFCEIHLNYANEISGCIARTNYVLPLNQTYQHLRLGFKKRLLENLQEADENNLIYEESFDFSNTISFFENEYGKKMSGTKKEDYQRFDKLCQTLFLEGLVFQRSVKDMHGTLLSSCIFLKDEKRIYNILSVTFSEGRRKRAHFFLVDHLIREFSGRNLMLDFEGSENPGIAEFYRKFGGINQPYWFYRFNRLPYPIKIFKK